MTSSFDDCWIEVTNPAGGSRKMCNDEYEHLLGSCLFHRGFIGFCADNNLCGEMNHFGETRMNIPVIKYWLMKIGYKIKEFPNDKN